MYPRKISGPPPPFNCFEITYYKLPFSFDEYNRTDIERISGFQGENSLEGARTIRIGFHREVNQSIFDVVYRQRDVKENVRKANRRGPSSWMAKSGTRVTEVLNGRLSIRETVPPFLFGEKIDNRKKRGNLCAREKAELLTRSLFLCLFCCVMIDKQSFARESKRFSINVMCKIRSKIVLRLHRDYLKEQSDLKRIFFRDCESRFFENFVENIFRNTSI